MLDNFYLIKELAKYLNENFAGFFISDIFSQEKNKAVFCLKKNSEIHFIEFAIDNKRNYLVIRENFSRAKKNTVDILPEALNSKIESIAIYNNDRIISLMLDTGFNILFSFVPQRKNIIILTNNNILTQFKKNKKEHKTVEEYFEKKIVNDFIPENIFEYIAKANPQLGKIYINEILQRINLVPGLELNNENKSIADKAAAEFITGFNNPEYFLYINGLSAIPSLVKLNHLRGYETKVFRNVIEMIYYYLNFNFKHIDYIQKQTSMLQEMDLKINKIKSKINLMNSTLVDNRNSEKYMQYGQLLLANINTSNSKNSVLNLTDENGTEYKIKIDNTLSISKNAQKYFDKYKRTKESVKLLEHKILYIQSKLNELIKKREYLSEIKNYKDLQKMEKELFPQENEEEKRHFRKFIIDDKYQIWVGKDSYSNDLLTTKYCSQNDLWFHVRGASGSHTVLKKNSKTDDVPKEIIKIAASIAAYYSKARNAGNVPVAYTEKKFVKKMKGMNQGAVIMEREKVVNIKPGLPPEV